MKHDESTTSFTSHAISAAALPTTSVCREFSSGNYRILDDKRLSIQRSRVELELLHDRIELGVVFVVSTVEDDRVYAGMTTRELYCGQ
jgi:hypothetical protein